MLLWVILTLMGIWTQHQSKSGLVKNGKLFIQAAAIVYDSNPEDEYQETINKASALMAAAEDFQI